MEQRKVMALGKSSLVVSMPKSWLNMNKISQGDLVSMVVQQNGSLVIYPSPDVKEEIRKIHLCVEADESKDSIVRRIISSFLDGYTTIKLTSEKIFSEGQQRAIRHIVGTLYMMIMESEASGIVLQTLIDESKASVSSGIERMHIITHSMCRDILRSMRDWDIDLAKSVVSLENDVDQLMFILSRLIRRAAISPSLANQLGLDPLDCLDYQAIVNRIERIADHNTSIANSLIELIEMRSETPKNVLGILTRAAEMAFDSYDEAIQGFFSKDVSKTNEIIDREKEIIELYSEITPLPLFGEPFETSVLSSIVTIRESIVKISHHAADIAEITIDRAYRL